MPAERDDATASTATDSPKKAVRRPRKAAKRKVAKKTPARRAKKKAARHSNGARRRGRKPYPVVVFEDALSIARGIMEHAAGNPVRRVTLLDLLDLNPSAQATRDLVTNSGKYGLTEGSYAANELSLTEAGRTVVDPNAAPRQVRQASFDLSISKVEPFKKLYDNFSGKSMPSLEVMQDLLTDLDVGDRRPCVDIFVGNAKFVGLLKTIGGVKHLLKIEDALDELARSKEVSNGDAGKADAQGDKSATPIRKSDYERTCFFIAPIGDKKSSDPAAVEHRQHSDTVLNQYIRRALEEQELDVVRADEIAESGMISKQIIDYILNSCLVIADLSYNNPNVFYELCLRHVTGKPTVHLIRKGDKIPFDVGNFRTITIALDDVHEAIAEIDTHRAEISNFVRQAVSTGQSKDNPILTFYPNATFSTGISDAANSAEAKGA